MSAPFEVWPLKHASAAELTAYRAALAKIDEALAILPAGTYRTSLLRTSEWMRRELAERDRRLGAPPLAEAESLEFLTTPFYFAWADADRQRGTLCAEGTDPEACEIAPVDAERAQRFRDALGMLGRIARRRVPS